MLSTVYRAIAGFETINQNTEVMYFMSNSRKMDEGIKRSFANE